MDFEVIDLRIILFIIGLALSLDGLYCGYTGSMGVGEAIIVADGIILLLWASFYDAFKHKKFLRFVKTLFSILMTVFIVYSCVVCTIGRLDNHTGRETYAIVLGSPLKDNEPTEVLASRLDAAVDYLEKNPDAKVVVSGARESMGELSEARAMSNYLILRGISDERIMMDESAFNTHGTFLNSRDVVENERVVFITSDFHVLRSAQMAELCGIYNASHIGAPTPPWQIPAACAREMLAQIYAFRYFVG